MNRKWAKILTTAGGFCCFVSIILFIANLYNETTSPQIISFTLFVVGVISIVLSLAYYTEK